MSGHSILQIDNKLWVDGKRVEKPKSLFFENCVVQSNNKIYINGKEFKKGKWKYTLRSLFNTLF